MRATLILGAGPGGTGPLVWAAQRGLLQSWLSAGVSLVDQDNRVGGGLGQYIINSDSLGGVYLECLNSPAARAMFAPLAADPATRELERLRHGLPPLALVGRYFNHLGAVLEQIVARNAGSEFIPRTTVRAVRYRRDGTLCAELVSPEGASAHINARTVILALGGLQDATTHRTAEVVADVRLADLPPGKIMPSDELLTALGRQRAATTIARAQSRRVVILGGSHSAFSAAWLLTNLMPEVTFGAGDIRIALRRWPPIFYATEAAAVADGYPMTRADLCPRTLRVNRFGGLRGDGRELWRRLTRRPGTVPEDRVIAMPLSERREARLALRRELNEAALVVSAFGYRARTVPVFDAEGRRIRLRAETDGPAVGQDARLLRDDGVALANLFGIGLGTGYRPVPPMGGEPSFRGQVNSLWLYQNDIGGTVYRGVQECLAAPKATTSVGVVATAAA
jgi:hypothetical protein